MSPSINTKPSDDPNMLEPNDTPGRRLRALRESRKLDIERIAAQLHLQRHVVEAIEGDQYERLPAPVFVVGYIKNYARLLGADPVPIVTAYRAAVPAREIGLGQVSTQSSDSTHSSGVGRWAWVFGVLLVGLATGMATLWLRGQSDSGLQSDTLALSPKVEDSVGPNPDASTVEAVVTTTSPQSVPEQTISAPPESIPLRRTEIPTTANPAVTPEPTAPTETLVAANTLISVPSPPETSGEPEEEEDAEAPTETATAEEPSTQAASSEVVLEFTGTSWVDVRSANGRVVLNGEMRSGDRRVLDGEPPYKLVIGNTAATQLTIGGRPFDLKRRAQGNVARFSLDPSSIE
jgi:cytoskeleton protein RodZ